MTDHYTESLTQLDLVTSESPAAGWVTARAVMAQVHATLALAEQRRIANLIALNQQWEESEHPDWYAQPARLRPEIARALRIETP